MLVFKNPVKVYNNNVIDKDIQELEKTEITFTQKQNIARTSNYPTENGVTINSVSGGYELTKYNAGNNGAILTILPIVIAPNQTITVSADVRCPVDVAMGHGYSARLHLWNDKYFGYKNFYNLPTYFNTIFLTYTNTTNTDVIAHIYLCPPERYHNNQSFNYSIIFKNVRIELGRNVTTQDYTYSISKKIEINSYNERFYFNAKEILKTYFNNKTEIHNLDAGAGPFLDTNACKTIQMISKLFLGEFGTKTYYTFFHAIRGAKQIKDTQPTRDTEILHNKYKGVVYITVWEDYPLCVSVYGQNLALSEPIFLATDLATPINELTNLSELTRELGVWRLPIHDGVEYMNGFAELQERENQIFLSSQTIIINKKKECGLYLKWLNDFGGWDYHMFTNFENSTTSKDFEILDTDFNNVEDSETNFISTGKEVKEKIKVFTNVEKHEFNKLTGILHSLKVFAYIDKTKWVQVNINGNAKTNSRQAKANLSFTLEIPNINTITL